VLRISIAVIFIAGFVSGCGGTIQLSKPTLTLSAQPALNLSPRVAFSITDDEATERGTDYTNKLAATICSAYPDAFTYRPAAKFPEQGKASLTPKIRQLGSYFKRTLASRLRRPVAHPASIQADFEDLSVVIRSATTGEPLVKGEIGGWLILPAFTMGGAGAESLISI